MGCFNGVCALSGLPIKHGEKIRFLLLRQHTHGYRPMVRVVYPASLYIPCCVPIRGEYNDYGFIENIVDDKNSQFLQKFLKSLFDNGLYLRDEKENRHETINAESLDGLIRALVYDEYQISSSFREVRKGETICYTIVSDFAWQTALKSCYAADADEYMESLPSFKNSADDYIPLVRHFDALGKIWQEQKTNGITDKEILHKSYCAHSNIYNWCSSIARAEKPELEGIEGLKALVEDEKFYENDFLSFFSESNDNNFCRGWFWDCYEKPIKENVKSGAWSQDTPEWIDIRDSLAEFAAVSCFMSRTSKFWTPFNYGGQDGDVMELSAFMDKCTRKAASKYKKYRQSLGYDY